MDDKEDVDSYCDQYQSLELRQACKEGAKKQKEVILKVISGE